jgi:cell volume regulation protein A
VLNIFSKEQLVSITPYFAALALIVILFDGGLNMDIRQAVKNSPRALILGIVGFLLNVLVTALLCKFLFDWRLMNGLLLGSILGGSSSIIVVALTRKLGIGGKTETILSLESILTDVLCTVGAFVAIDIILSGEVSLQATLGSIALAFAVGIVVGSLVGIAWLNVLERVKGKTNTYMLTLAVLLLTYLAARNLGGTGALSTLFLGLIVGNGPTIAKLLKIKYTVSIDESVRGFHGQISFLIRSFFFVFTGLLFSYSSYIFVLFGVLLAFVYLVLRFAAVKISFLKSTKDSEKIMTVMLPRGLAAAVLASLPLTSGVPNSQDFPQIAFIVIITSIIICTVGVGILKKRTQKT